MNIRFFLGIIPLVVLLSFTPVHAEDSSSGCGPGWYILQDNSFVSSALRLTTNVALFPVTLLGMTFGTSHCGRHRLVLKEKESLHFVTHNYFELKGEVARGDGQYLQAYAHTLGCPATAQPLFNAEMKNRYHEIFGQPGIHPEKALIQTYVTIFANSELTRVCDAT